LEGKGRGKKGFNLILGFGEIWGNPGIFKLRRKKSLTLKPKLFNWGEGKLGPV